MPEPELIDDELEYEVEAIIGERLFRGKTQYLVKWKGHHIENATWEPIANLTHCDEVLAEWKQRSQSKGVREDAHNSEEGEDVTVSGVRGAQTRGRQSRSRAGRATSEQQRQKRSKTRKSR